MSITIQLDLPDAVLQQARALGLLENQQMTELLANEVCRRHTGEALKQILGEVRSIPGEPVTMDEINTEIEAARVERRAREAGR